jgi:hypothetical protein
VQDVVLGILAVLIGAIFCFRGYLTMRVIIPIWGAFGGFILGAAIVSSSDGDGFLRSTLAWVVGIVVGFIFGLLAYLYFEVSVVLAMAAIGFTLGVSAMVAIGVSWDWVIVFVGLATGVLLAIVALAGNLPMVLLTVLTATSGASTIVGGIMLLTDKLQSGDITESGAVTDRLHDDWWWYAIWGGLVVAGIVAQFAAADRLAGTMREAWDESKGNSVAA